MRNDNAGKSRDFILDLRLVSIVGSLLLVASIAFNSCYALSTVSPFHNLMIPMLAVGILGCFLLKDGVTKKQGFFLNNCFAVVLIGFFFLSTFANMSFGNVIDFVQYSLLIVLAAFCVERIPARIFFKTFSYLMCVVSVIALIGWVYVVIVGEVLPFPIVKNVNGALYSSGLVVFQFANMHIDPSTSLGIFWEGGVFSSFLLTAIVIELLANRPHKKRRILLYSLVLLTTKSTAGIMLLPVCLAIPLMSKKSRYRYPIFFALLVVLLLLLFNESIIRDTLYEFNPLLFSKLIDAEMVTTSTRILSPEICWNLFLESPLVGHGSSGATEMYVSIIKGMPNVDSLTSTTFYYFAAFGLAGFLILLAWVYGIIFNPKITILQGILILVIGFFIMNKEPHSLTAFYYCLMFYLTKEAYLGRQAGRQDQYACHLQVV